ncbi:NADP-dependent glyceraldehyde-3-phosphate dehydrogenase [Paraburkholderia phenoliruptrix]|uniref:NADP-dependent glyceraldehyde-3-phosphate dehydrogenase n=1 Tax=Paraburkholderia phenoliruptrix TaxID=252970 RepID=UPI002869BCF1|nr:NADP-dependent glyceraldehyde-3-phosphate dehydrogenase [Paraburkholderia phenoliruptrix]WMY11792.1 NADP-dependent glyceraldehyde-3-phosphate dehydrogenase [Paraburkholderia phenoliruptrix]
MTISPNANTTIFPRDGDVPHDCRIEPLHQRTILIDGDLEEWAGPVRAVHAAVSLADEQGHLHPYELGSVPDGGTSEAFRALQAAEAAYDNGRGRWPSMLPSERIACVEDFAQRLLEKRGEIVKLIMWEIGKTLADSEKEFDRTIVYIRDTVQALKKLENRSATFEVVDGTIGHIRRVPLGVTLCLGPYNYPLNETFTTLIPALIMGNVVLLKPPTLGVLLYSHMLEAFSKAFPPGVVSTLYGQGATVITPLMQSGRVNVLAFIGSSNVADQLKKAHPKSNRLRAVLGLDAKNAAIVLADADIDHAIKECVSGALSFNGQRCTAIKMILVHRSISDEFVQRLSVAVSQLKRGMPWVPGVVITPLPDSGKCEYLSSCLDDAIDNGAKVMNTGGGVVEGTLFNPAVVYPVAEGMKLYREEQFGPIVPVAPFDDIEGALDYVVTSDFGQQVSIFGREPGQIGQLVDALANQVCRINLNSQCQRGPDSFPFAGRKDSAEGTLSVHDALRAFSIRSMVSAKENQGSTQLIQSIVASNTSRFLRTTFTF